MAFKHLSSLQHIDAGQRKTVYVALTWLVFCQFSFSPALLLLLTQPILITVSCVCYTPTHSCLPIHLEVLCIPIAKTVFSHRSFSKNSPPPCSDCSPSLLYLKSPSQHHLSHLTSLLHPSFTKTASNPASISPLLLSACSLGIDC